MYRVDLQEKQLIPLTTKRLGELGLMERFDLQEWIEKTPEILGEELLVVSKELELSHGSRLDLLAIDRGGRLVVVELKRDGSGRNVEWQAIRYASYVSGFDVDETVAHFAKYQGVPVEDAQAEIEEFIDCELDDVNEAQRIILVAQEFHSDVASSVLWLRDYGVEVACIRLRPYVDGEGALFITPDKIIPLKEASDYIERKEARQQGALRRPKRSAFSVEQGNFELPELKARLDATLRRQSDLTPRLRAFVQILTDADGPVPRDEMKSKLFAAGIGEDLGQAGRYLSNISQFLTKNSNPHLRQLVSFDGGHERGQPKDNYRLREEYRGIVENALMPPA